MLLKSIPLPLLQWERAIVRTQWWLILQRYQMKPLFRGSSHVFQFADIETNQSLELLVCFSFPIQSPNAVAFYSHCITVAIFSLFRLHNTSIVQLSLLTSVRRFKDAGIVAPRTYNQPVKYLWSFVDFTFSYWREDKPGVLSDSSSTGKSTEGSK